MGRALVWTGTILGLVAGLNIMFHAIVESEVPLPLRLFGFAAGALLFTHLLRGTIREWRTWRRRRFRDPADPKPSSGE